MEQHCPLMQNNAPPWPPSERARGEHGAPGDRAMAMDLNELVVFAHVVRLGSFTAAAHELQMQKSGVSRKVADLEERLGTRLLQRTTRKLNLTDEGRVFYEHCTRVLAEI